MTKVFGLLILVIPGLIRDRYAPRPALMANPFILTAALPSDLAGLAAVTDQSGGWAALRLSGPHAADALMRLYPLDLRAAHFPKDTCARAPLGHMQSILIAEEAGFLILIFRSMARTAWHEIEAAMQALTARAAAV
mgnify:CR=1 FL=1